MDENESELASSVAAADDAEEEDDDIIILGNVVGHKTTGLQKEE